MVVANNRCTLRLMSWRLACCLMSAVLAFGLGLGPLSHGKQTYSTSAQWKLTRLRESCECEPECDSKAQIAFSAGGLIHVSETKSKWRSC